MKDICQQCFGEMEIDPDIIDQAYARVCTMCTDKPVNKVTDHMAVGHSLVRNDRQLKP